MSEEGFKCWRINCTHQYDADEPDWAHCGCKYRVIDAKGNCEMFKPRPDGEKRLPTTEYRPGEDY